MKWNKALIYTTIISYLTALVVTGILRIPVMEGVPLLAQTLTFLVFGGLLLQSLNPRGLNPQSQDLLCAIMASIYGVLAPLSFLGIQKWINYYGTLSLGPYMAIWDLALAIALLTLEERSHEAV